MNRNLSSLLKKPLLIKAGFLLGLVIVALLFGMLAYLAVRNLVFSDARAAQSGPDIVEGQGIEKGMTVAVPGEFSVE